jgi:putative addiction module antidote
MEEGAVVKETVIRAIGNSAGATIPKPMLEHLKVAEGDTVFLVEVAGGVLLTPYDPAFAEAMAAYEEGASAYRNAMRGLADG